jgi:hypothetical protein
MPVPGTIIPDISSGARWPLDTVEEMKSGDTYLVDMNKTRESTQKEACTVALERSLISHHDMQTDRQRSPCMHEKPW